MGIFLNPDSGTEEHVPDQEITEWNAWYSREEFETTREQQARLEKIVENISYKPGWDIEVMERGPLPLNVNVLVRVKCVCSRTGDDITQNFMMGLVVYELTKLSDHDILVRLHDFILRIEHHESSEIFRYKCEMIFDPHEYPYDGRI